MNYLNPRASFWVGASAGTGKTYALTHRALRLVLEGVAPKRILCLTFTNAAANEMRQRILAQLTMFQGMEADALVAALKAREIYPDKPAEEILGIIQQALTTLDQLRIQTFHGFCQSLLRLFPIEAGLLPTFRVLDEGEAMQLWALAVERAIQQAPEPMLQGLVRHATWTQLTQLLQDAYGHKAKEAGCLDEVEQPEAVVADFPFPDQEQAERARFLGAFEQETGVRAQKLFQALAGYWENPKRLQEDFRGYAALFLTTTGALRQTLLPKKFQTQHPPLSAWFMGHMAQVKDHVEQLQLQQILENTRLFKSLVQDVMAHYTALKQQKGGVDYDDLILKTKTLLTETLAQDWVKYKLDGGFHHVLVDEAQDTSRIQWAVIGALVEDFFGGKSRVEAPRTLFVVGDEKQSIYRFQGADPEAFMEMFHRFQGKIQPLQQDPFYVQLPTSYRSTEAVLKFVDQVANRPEMALGNNGPVHHGVARVGAPGAVYVWDIVRHRGDNGPSGRFVLARALADTLHTWLQEKRWLAAKERPLLPGDIMILLRQRGPFLGALVHALKERGVPVAGRDRFFLLDHPATHDFCALAAAALLPEDDFMLALALKGPLFGWQDKDLQPLAAQREGLSLYQRLLAAAETGHQKARFAVETMGALHFVARQGSPERVIFSIFHQWAGREAFLDMFGSGCLDVLEALERAALDYAQREGGDLRAFLKWLKQMNPQIKRPQQEAQHSAVRIMTVHGAKGLQAPVVIMPDTTQLPQERRTLFWDEEGVVWNPENAWQAPPLATRTTRATQKKMADYYRLLYVALTRAEDELHIVGWDTHHGIKEDSWYAICKAAMGAFAPQPFVLSKEIQGQVFHAGASTDSHDRGLVQKSRACGHTSKQPPQQGFDAPAWLHEQVVREGDIKVFQPSAGLPGEDETVAQSQEEASASQTQAKARGVLMHRVLELGPLLMGQSSDARTALVHQLNEKASLPLAAEMVEDVVAKALVILKGPAYQPYLGEDVFREVNVQGWVDERFYRGQIDVVRVDLVKKEVHILDYKTGQPKDSPSYGEQLTLYATLLERDYPGYHITASLLWVDTGRVEEMLGA